jgi:hypothetical protein
MKNTKLAKLLLLLPAVVLSSCGATTLTTEELNTRVDAMYLGIHGDEETGVESTWVAPEAMKVDFTYHSSMAFGGDPMVQDESMSAEFDLAKGYFKIEMTQYGEEQALAIWTEDTSLYYAMNAQGQKLYQKVTFASAEQATTAAVTLLGQEENVVGMLPEVTFFATGSDELFMLDGFIDQVLTYEDEDPENDYTAEYQNYDLTLTSKAVGEKGFEAELTLSASNHAEEAGMTMDEAMSGTVSVKFNKDGYLTHSSNAATMSYEIKDAEGTVLESMLVEDSTTVNISYSVTVTPLDLTGYTQVGA